MLDEQTLEIRSSQPYIVFDSEKFFQRKFDSLGITHFFSFKSKSRDSKNVSFLADGCSNIFFAFNENGMDSFIMGPTFQIGDFNFDSDSTYFGVRFQPGENPCLQKILAKDIIGKKMQLDEFPAFDFLVEKMKETKDFETRINVFLDEYKKIMSENISSQKKLYRQFIQLIAKKRGIIKIRDLIVLTGYSARYINQIFEDVSGMSAKHFCNLVRLHYIVNDLNFGNYESFSKLASDYSFYDTAHFSHEFKNFAGVTPGDYIDLVEKMGYKNLVVNL